MCVCCYYKIYTSKTILKKLLKNIPTYRLDRNNVLLLHLQQHQVWISFFFHHPGTHLVFFFWETAYLSKHVPPRRVLVQWHPNHHEFFHILLFHFSNVLKVAILFELIFFVHHHVHGLRNK